MDIESGSETSRIHGFTISREHAETKVAEQRRIFSRPFSRVRVVDVKITEAVRQEIVSPPWRRHKPWV